jgi:hypothetical protein
VLPDQDGQTVTAPAAATTNVVGSRLVGAQRARATALSSCMLPACARNSYTPSGTRPAPCRRDSGPAQDPRDSMYGRAVGAGREGHNEVAVEDVVMNELLTDG